MTTRRYLLWTWLLATLLFNACSPVGSSPAVTTPEPGKPTLLYFWSDP